MSTARQIGSKQALGLVLTAGLAAAGAMGCAGDERVAPVSTGGEGGSGTTSSSSSSTSSSVASSGAGTPVREVFVRNPFGDQADNLLADGDFELSVTSNPGQQAWTYYGFQGQQPMQSETGGLCRSGLRCAHVPAGGVLFGRGTAAADRSPMQAEVWVKPLEGATCDVNIFVLDCDSFSVRGSLISLPGSTEDGWCPLRANVAPSSTGICLYLDNDQTGPMLVDHASLRARAVDESKRVAEPPPVVAAATRARMERVRDEIRKKLPLGTPPRLPPGAPRPPGAPGPQLDLDARP